MPHFGVSGERLDRSTLGYVYVVCLRAYVCEPCRTGPWECALSPELSESEPVCQQTHPAGSALRQAYHSPLIIAGATSSSSLLTWSRGPQFEAKKRERRNTQQCCPKRGRPRLFPGQQARTAEAGAAMAFANADV